MSSAAKSPRAGADRAKALFHNTGILTDVELESRYHVRLERYIKDILIELHTLQQMVDTQVLPAAYAYLAQLSSIRTHDMTDRLRDIGVPTLVLAGEEDVLIPVRLSRRLCDDITGAEWTTVKGGHACLWEFPASFNTAVIEFLDRHRG